VERVEAVTAQLPSAEAIRRLEAAGTREALRRVGYSEQEVDALVASGAARVRS
jgi:hypothetical protein